MVTTSALDAAALPRQLHTDTAAQAERSANCEIWALDGTLLGRATAIARPVTLPAEAYAIEVRDVSPVGALESAWSRESAMVVRINQAPPQSLELDHIIGPISARRYYFRETMSPTAT